MTPEIPPPIVFLRGPRIYFRPVEPTDLDLFQRWINEPETRRNLASFRPMNSLAERDWLENKSKSPDDYILAIVRTADNAHIGACGLHGVSWKNRSATFGILIGEPAARNQGFGTEATRLMLQYAFHTLNLNRIELDVYDINPAGIRAYEKCGFIREGFFRQYAFVEGAYVNAYHYAMLAGEFGPTRT